MHILNSSYPDWHRLPKTSREEPMPLDAHVTDTPFAAQICGAVKRY